MILIEKITKIYNENKVNSLTALDNVSLEIKQGEMVAITGKSGAGKSTLLHILGCVDRVTDGKYMFQKKLVNKLTNTELARLRSEDIGFVMQDFGLILEETVLHNVMLPLFFDKTKISDMNKKAIIALEKINILELKNKLVRNLSGGQKQRVAIARAIINNPSLLLADEPTGSLDSGTSKEIMSVFKMLNEQGTTIIIVTHEPNIASYCKREIVILDGKIISTIKNDN